MPESFKKTKLYVGITLMVQSFTFVILFLMLFSKKRSFARAFLAMAAIGGATGAYLLWLERKENDAFLEDDSYPEEWFPYESDEIEVEEDVDIPADETVTESEFEG